MEKLRRNRKKRAKRGHKPKATSKFKQKEKLKNV